LEGSAKPVELPDAVKRSNARIAAGVLVPEPNAREQVREYTTEQRDAALGIDPIDLRNKIAAAPAYKAEGLLPKVFENYVTDCLAQYGGDRGSYAAGFTPQAVGAMHESVKMQENPLAPENWSCPNEFVLLLSASGDDKSGWFKDLMRAQAARQSELIDIFKAMKKAKPRFKGRVAACMVTSGTIEGFVRQLEANDSAERLMGASDEAMGLFRGAAAHHKQGGIDMLAAIVAKMYDGDAYIKPMANETIIVPHMLATLVTATVIERMAEWEELSALIDAGVMARFNVGAINPRNLVKANRDDLKAGARDALFAVLNHIRAMRDVQFVLEPAVHDRWLAYIERRKEKNEAMAKGGATKGLVLWCKKFSKRIMSTAVALQVYEDFANHTRPVMEEPISAKASEGGTNAEQATSAEVQRTLKTFYVSTANLDRAIKLFEGFLYRTQAFFYKLAQGQSEFGMEIRNYVAKMVTNGITHVSRNGLTYSGPNSIRADNGGITAEVKEKQGRWIAALLDHGVIVVDPDRLRGKRLANERDAKWFCINPTLHTMYDEGFRAELAAEHAALRGKLQVAFGSGGDGDEAVEL